jgi:methyltransferase family protein
MIAKLAEFARLVSMAPLGPIVEVGVYGGDSAYYLMQVAWDRTVELHQFDTFSGTPHRIDMDNHQVGVFGDVSLDTVRGFLPSAIFNVGVFPDSLPDDLTDIAFAHVDCDRHSSIRACIDLLRPRMVPGGVMLFDDFTDTRGCVKAVDETFPHLYLTVFGKAYVVKP